MKAKSGDISDVCTCLATTGVIVLTPDFEHWSLSVDPAEVTLEEVWRAIGGIASVSGPDSDDCDNASVYKVDLLTSQAFLGLDQSIATHLRRFRLDTVQTSGRHFVRMSTTRKYEPDVDSVEAAYA
ncbi:hypothetical protein ASE07_26880 [Noviherbaspirillum sp. Root189]|nr:hypothetical protein ASE07_26880 [Noviherbaspirillum sp. Root189]